MVRLVLFRVCLARVRLRPTVRDTKPDIINELYMAMSYYYYYYYYVILHT